jgi:pimeloyl-ACP methyl ester carboxylesterase
MSQGATGAKIRRHYTESRYGQLHYLQGLPAGDIADKGKTTLVLLHQNPSSCLEYQHLLAEMAKDRRVIAFDTPGNGMSDGPSGPSAIKDYAAAFSDGLDRLGFGPDMKIDVFGFHTGTLLSAELAIQRPDIVRRVALSGIPFRSKAERAEKLAAVRNTPPLTDDGKSVFDRLGWLWRFVVADRAPGVPIEGAAFMFIEKAKTLNRYWWPYEGVWSYPIEDQFPRVSQPVLVIQPREDLLEQSRAAVDLFRNAEFVELPTLVRDVFEVGVAEFAGEFRRFFG